MKLISPVIRGALCISMLMGLRNGILFGQNGLLKNSPEKLATFLLDKMPDQREAISEIISRLQLGSTLWIFDSQGDGDEAISRLIADFLKIPTIEIDTGNLDEIISGEGKTFESLKQLTPERKAVIIFKQISTENAQRAAYQKIAVQILQNSSYFLNGAELDFRNQVLIFTNDLTSQYEYGRPTYVTHNMFLKHLVQALEEGIEVKNRGNTSLHKVSRPLLDLLSDRMVLLDPPVNPTVLKLLKRNLDTPLSDDEEKVLRSFREQICLSCHRSSGFEFDPMDIQAWRANRGSGESFARRVLDMIRAKRMPPSKQTRLYFDLFIQSPRGVALLRYLESINQE